MLFLQKINVVINRTLARPTGSQRLQVRLRGARPRDVRREERVGSARGRHRQGSVQRDGTGRRREIGRVHRGPGPRIQRGGQPVGQR